MNYENKTSSDDMKGLAFALPYTRPADIPIAFVYKGKRFRGLGDELAPQECFRRIDSNVTLTAVTGKLDGIEIRVEYKQYSDFPVTEWVAYFKNVSNKNSDILSDVSIGEGHLPIDNPTLVYSNGDDMSTDGYEIFENDLKSHFRLRPNDSGTPCAGAFPYMRLRGETRGVNIAVGWTGTWRADFEKTETGVSVSFGQLRCHTYLKPGETLRTPRVNFQAYSGDESHGRNLWRRFFMKHILVKDPDGRPLPAKLCTHVMSVDGHPEFTGATEENQLRGIREFLRHGIRPDIWWIDAGWYPCDYDWPRTGSWFENVENWPNGLAPIGEECAKNGIQLLLWFEPERVRGGTWLANEHPEWLLSHGDDDNHLLDLSNPEALEWLIGHVDRLIKKWHVSIYRQDFNFDPMPIWQENESEDRIGIIENLHIQGYYKYWDELMRRNPGLWIDSCASGGRRNDPETMRRAVPLHYTDVGYGIHPIKQKQHRLMFEWIPYFRAHNMSWDNQNGEYFMPDGGRPIDEFAYQAAMAPALTDMIEWNASESDFETARRMHRIWRRAANLMTVCDYYPMTECRKDPSDFYAMEFFSPELKKGFFQVLANTKVSHDSFTVRLVLDESLEYLLENSSTGEKTVISGAELSRGYEVHMHPRTGTVYFFEAAEN